MASLDIARDLLARGFQPVLVRHKSKRPTLGEWQTQRYKMKDLPAVFTNGANVGILLGTPSDETVDLDLDHPLATRILQILGEPKTLAYTHAGRNHYLFRAEPPIPSTEKYVGIRDRQAVTFVELRSTGGQTLAPGSVHPDDGTLYEWVHDVERQELTAAQLRELGRDIATACLLADHWHAPHPEEHGARNQLALCFAGFLARREVALDHIEDLIRAAATVMQDRELDNRLGAVRATVRKYQSGGKIAGLPTLAEYIGQDDANTLNKWWPDLDPRMKGQESSHQNGTATGSSFTGNETTGEPSPEFLVYAADDFLDLEMPEWSFIVPGHIGDESIVIFYGATATLKTYVATDLAISVALGQPWCGWFDAAQGRVLVVEEDTPKSLYQQKYLRPMVAARHIDPADLHDHLYVAVSNGFQLDVAARVHQLEQWLAQYRPRLVILDAFYLLHRQDSKDETALVPVLRVLRGLRETFHCTIVLIDHSRKSGSVKSEADPIDDLYGGQAKAANSDGLVQFLRVKGEKSMTYLAVRKVRGEVLPDPVRLKLADGLLTVDGEEEVTEDGSSRVVYDWLYRVGGTRTYQQISDAVNLSVKTVTRACADLERKHRVFKGRQGKEVTFLAVDSVNPEGGNEEEIPW